MATLNWGEPRIFVSKLDDSDEPTTWIELEVPKEDTTNLDSQEGEKIEARQEGGIVVDSKTKPNNYFFDFTEFVKKDKESPIESMDGVVAGFWALKLVPEDPQCKGLSIAKASVSVSETYNVKDGSERKVRFSCIKKDKETPIVDTSKTVAVPTT